MEFGIFLPSEFAEFYRENIEIIVFRKNHDQSDPTWSERRCTFVLKETSPMLGLYLEPLRQYVRCLFSKEGKGCEVIILENEIEWMNTSLSFLYLFLQINFTGPFNLETDSIIIESLLNKLCCDIEDADLLSREYLRRTEDNLCKSIGFAPLLYIGMDIVTRLLKLYPSNLAYTWWFSRFIFIHQCILQDMDYDLFHNAKTGHEALYSFFVSQYRDNPTIERIFVQFLVETISLHTFFRSDKYIIYERTFLDITKFEFKLVGVLGKSTKFQNDESSILFLQTGLNRNTQGKQMFPKDVNLDDDILLNTPILSDDHNPIVEKSLDNNRDHIFQCFILSKCIHISNNSPRDSIRDEECLAYVRCVLEVSDDWLVRTACLYLRSIFEFGGSRRSERSLSQLQVLTDQIKVHTSTEQYVDRVNLIFTLQSMNLSRRCIEAELARFYMKLGLFTSAAATFERLGNIHSALECLLMSQQNDKAISLVWSGLSEYGIDPKTINDTNVKTSCLEKYVLERLSLYFKRGGIKQTAAMDKIVHESSYLLSIAGGLTGNKRLLKTSIHISNAKYYNALRNLGDYYLSLYNKQKDTNYRYYLKSILCYKKSLENNPHSSGTWFLLGNLYMNVDEKWDLSKVNALETKFAIKIFSGPSISSKIDANPTLDGIPIHHRISICCFLLASQYETDEEQCSKFYNHMGIVYVFNKKHMNAYHCFKESIRLHKSCNMQLLVNLWQSAAILLSPSNSNALSDEIVANLWLDGICSVGEILQLSTTDAHNKDNLKNILFLANLVTLERFNSCFSSVLGILEEAEKKLSGSWIFWNIFSLFLVSLKNFLTSDPEKSMSFFDGIKHINRDFIGIKEIGTDLQEDISNHLLKKSVDFNWRSYQLISSQPLDNNLEDTLECFNINLDTLNPSSQLRHLSNLVVLNNNPSNLYSAVKVLSDLVGQCVYSTESARNKENLITAFQLLSRKTECFQVDSRIHEHIGKIVRFLQDQ